MHRQTVQGDMSDLELYTIDELIEELERRYTFQGVIVRTKSTFRGEPWNEGSKTFRASWVNLSREQAITILEGTAYHLENK